MSEQWVENQSEKADHAFSHGVSKQQVVPAPGVATGEPSADRKDRQYQSLGLSSMT